MSQFETAVRYFKSVSTPQAKKLVHNKLEAMWNGCVHSLRSDAKMVMDLLEHIAMDNLVRDEDALTLAHGSLGPPTEPRQANDQYKRGCKRLGADQLDLIET